MPTTCGLHEKGDKVEADYKGRGKYFEGKISRVNLDGTYDITYDDGNKETYKKASEIKSLGGGGDSKRWSQKIGQPIQDKDMVSIFYETNSPYYRWSSVRVSSVDRDRNTVTCTYLLDAQVIHLGPQAKNYHENQQITRDEHNMTIFNQCNYDFNSKNMLRGVCPEKKLWIVAVNGDNIIVHPEKPLAIPNFDLNPHK